MIPILTVRSKSSLPIPDQLRKLSKQYIKWMMRLAATSPLKKVVRKRILKKLRSIDRQWKYLSTFTVSRLA